MVFGGQHRLLTGFSNFTNIEQAYPNWLNSGPTFPQGNQAQEIFISILSFHSYTNKIHKSIN